MDAAVYIATQAACVARAWHTAGQPKPLNGTDAAVLNTAEHKTAPQQLKTKHKL